VLLNNIRASIYFNGGAVVFSFRFSTAYRVIFDVSDGVCVPKNPLQMRFGGSGNTTLM